MRSLLTVSYRRDNEIRCLVTADSGSSQPLVGGNASRIYACHNRTSCHIAGRIRMNQAIDPPLVPKLQATTLSHSPSHPLFRSKEPAVEPFHNNNERPREPHKPRKPLRGTPVDMCALHKASDHRKPLRSSSLCHNWYRHNVC